MNEEAAVLVAAKKAGEAKVAPDVLATMPSDQAFSLASNYRRLENEAHEALDRLIAKHRGGA